MSAKLSLREKIEIVGFGIFWTNKSRILKSQIFRSQLFFFSTQLFLRFQNLRFFFFAIRKCEMIRADLHVQIMILLILQTYMHKSYSSVLQIKAILVYYIYIFIKAILAYYNHDPDYKHSSSVHTVHTW